MTKTKFYLNTLEYQLIYKAHIVMMTNFVSTCLKKKVLYFQQKKEISKAIKCLLDKKMISNS